MFIRLSTSQPRFFYLAHKALILLCLTVGIVGCGSTASKHTSTSTHSGSDKLNFSNTGKGSTGKLTPQQAALTRHYNAWRNAPYKLGGLSKTGVDCSGFIQVTYRDVFNKKVPRSTEQQAKIGKKITPQSLKFGDLIFFKTGRSQRHVGIYINNGRFIHASSSRGVMQSSLTSRYWSQRYWKAQRIL